LGIIYYSQTTNSKIFNSIDKNIFMIWIVYYLLKNKNKHLNKKLKGIDYIHILS
jgi:hypothetical protein